MNNSSYTGNSNWYISKPTDKFYIVFWMYGAGLCCQMSNKEVTNILLSARNHTKAKGALYYPLQI